MNVVQVYYIVSALKVIERQERQENGFLLTSLLTQSLELFWMDKEMKYIVKWILRQYHLPLHTLCLSLSPLPFGLQVVGEFTLLTSNYCHTHENVYSKWKQAVV